MKQAYQRVELIDSMGSDLSVVNAARVSFAKQKEEFDVNTDSGLINYLAFHNHWTTFGHAFVTFRIKAPIFVARQLVKHQVGLVWNEESRRYISDEPQFYIPPYLRPRPENVKQGSLNESLENSPGLIQLIEDHCDQCLILYQSLLDQGVAPEQARIVLPLNVHTNWIWSGSLAAWARVCNLRLDPHAQLECQEIAEEIDQFMKDIFPVSWEALIKV